MTARSKVCLLRPMPAVPLGGRIPASDPSRTPERSGRRTGIRCTSIGFGPDFRLIKRGGLTASKNGMTATVDSAGKTAIPRAVCYAAHLAPGTKVRLRVTPCGRMEIEPEPLSVVLERRGRPTVAVRMDRCSALKQTEVDRTFAAIRAGS